MKTAILSGSRADAGALVAVEQALVRAGVTIGWFDIPGPTLRQDSRLDVASACALATSATAKYLHENPPDLVVVHGDRYEVLGAATAAFLLGLPIAHLGGGDITEGSQDDSIRHSISKLSHLHFCTCDDSARRLVQLGEHPTRVFNVGDPGVDVFFGGGELLPLEAVLKSLGLTTERYFLVAFHPNTLGDTASELMTLVEALKRSRKLLPDVGLVMLDPNKDADYLLIEQQFQRFTGSNVKYINNLPRTVYLSALKHAIALIGNSSAAFYEAPSLATHVINFGDRQKGRNIAFNCLATVTTVDETLKAMKKAYENPIVPSYYNPYGDGYACDRIAKIISTIKPKDLLRKSFYNLPCEESCLTGFGKRYMLPVSGDGTQRKSSSGGLYAHMDHAQSAMPFDSSILGAAQARLPGFWPEKDSE